MNKVITLSIVLFLIPFFLVDVQAQWNSINFYPEGSAYSCASFVIGNKAYVGGGNTSKKSFYVLDLETDEWTKLADIPGGVNRASPISFVIDGIGYIGCGGDQFKGSTETFYAFDPSDGSWTRKADFGGGVRFSGLYLSANNKGYVFCGTGENDSVGDVWEYDPENDEWNQKADFPGGATYWPTGFEIDGKIYVGTGGSLGGGFLEEFYEYDPTTDQWSELGKFGGPHRSGAVGFAVNGKGYIGGGAMAQLAGSHTDFYEFDPATKAWRKADDLEYPITNTIWSTAFVHNSSVYMGTGARIAGTVRPTSRWFKTEIYSPQVISNSVLTQITCEGGSDGAIDITVTGGVPPYEFEWSTGETTEDISNLTEGEYSVDIQDATGNLVSSPNYQISSQYYIAIDESTVETDACESGNGSITIHASTNSQELLYSWSHDATLKSNVAMDLPADTYETTIQNEFGCVEVVSNQVESSDGPSIIVSEFVEPNCTGVDRGSITISVSGGHGTSIVSWTGPHGFASDQLSVSDMDFGTYLVAIIDERDCMATMSFEIVEPETPEGDIDVNPSNGGESSGVITISNVTGGLSPYQFELFDENGSKLETNATGVFDSLGVGIYSVKIIDANQCSVEYSDLGIILSNAENLNFNVGLNAFPNPIHNWLLISSNELQYGDYNIRITDVAGRTWLRSALVSGRIDLKVDVSNLDSGMYFITLSSENINQTISIIK